MALEDTIVWKDEAVKHKGELLEQLLSVIDPELGIDIVNLGLIYEVGLDENGCSHVILSLTTVACPLGGYIEEEIQRLLMESPLVEQATTEVTFDPPWDVSRISRYGRIALNIPG